MGVCQDLASGGCSDDRCFQRKPRIQRTTYAYYHDYHEYFGNANSCPMRTPMRQNRNHPGLCFVSFLGLNSLLDSQNRKQ